MNRRPTDILIKSLARHTRAQLIEDARWHSKLKDPYGIADEIQALAEAPISVMFAGLSALADPNRCSFQRDDVVQLIGPAPAGLPPRENYTILGIDESGNLALDDDLDHWFSWRHFRRVERAEEAEVGQ